MRALISCSCLFVGSRLADSQEAAGAYDAEARRVFHGSDPPLNFPVSVQEKALDGLGGGGRELRLQLCRAGALRAAIVVFLVSCSTSVA